MKNLKTKSFVYQLVAYMIIYFPLKYLLETQTNLSGIFIPLTAILIVTIIGPKFQAVKTNDGEKIFMKWIFLKGFRILK
jgi:hypothetical protein